MSQGLWTQRVELAAEGFDEGRHVPVALDPSEGPLGFEHPGGDPALFIEPSRQRVTRPVVRRATEIIDSMQLVLVRFLASC